MIGCRYFTDEGYWFTVVSKDEKPRYYNIRFDDGNTKKSHIAHIQSGKIKNPFVKTVFGVGYLGDGPYKRGTVYNRWYGMMRRCYSDEFPAYKGCSVCANWHNYQNYAEFVTSNLPKFSDWEVDKDLALDGNKVYSPETVSFIPSFVNKAIASSTSDNGLPTGVQKSNCKKESYYTRFVDIEGKQVYLGSYETADEAFEVYRLNKEMLFKQLAFKYKDVISDKSFYDLSNRRVQKWHS